MGLLKGTWGGVCYTITTTDCDCGTYLTHKPWTVIIVCQSVYRLESGLGHTLHNILWKLKQSFSLTFFSCWTTHSVVYPFYWGQTLLPGFAIGLLKCTFGGVFYTVTATGCDLNTHLTSKLWTIIIFCKKSLVKCNGKSSYFCYNCKLGASTIHWGVSFGSFNLKIPIGDFFMVY